VERYLYEIHTYYKRLNLKVMFKDTMQQILLFLFTSSLVYYCGKHLMAQNGLESLVDFVIGTVFFFSFIFFMNYFVRLLTKIFGSVAY
jgi:hypothetical protein